MNLNRTKQLLHEGIDSDHPTDSLIHILEASIELISLPDNDFSWSYWMDEAEARDEITRLIDTLKNGSLPPRLNVAVLFTPTGPLQEVSLSSGWGETFLKVAGKYDEVEALLWQAI